MVSRDEEARSTERPPAGEGEEDGVDIASAIQRAKTNASPGRYGPPAATAKIDKFDLAQALALTTAEGEQVPSSSKPPREDDAPFVPGEVEVVGEEEVNSGVPGLDSLPPGSGKPKSTKSKTPEPLPVSAAAANVDTAIVPRPASGNIVLVILGLLIGVVVMAYVYVSTR